MSWKKRPSVIKKDKVSILIPYHIGMDEIVEQEDRGEEGSAVEDVTEIHSGDFNHE